MDFLYLIAPAVLAFVAFVLGLFVTHLLRKPLECSVPAVSELELARLSEAHFRSDKNEPLEEEHQREYENNWVAGSRPVLRGLITNCAESVLVTKPPIPEKISKDEIQNYTSGPDIYLDVDVCWDDWTKREHRLVCLKVAHQEHIDEIVKLIASDQICSEELLVVSGEDQCGYELCFYNTLDGLRTVLRPLIADSKSVLKGVTFVVNRVTYNGNDLYA